MQIPLKNLMRYVNIMRNCTLTYFGLSTMIDRKVSTEKMLTINIDPELKKLLRKFAEEDERTLSSLVKIVLRNYVKQRTLAKNSVNTTA